MSLEQLDAFLASARRDPELRLRLQNRDDPPDLQEFLALASRAGFQVEEADVIAAQLRGDAELSNEELQRRAGEEARRLRHFLHG